ncbi:SdpI family protein [Neobacillus ginsengisoli]|uniref:Type IV secretory pathway VirB3-like protein n=1 Tax=Neobacillus ginsengisoli TaxID=904295 RepID=A0ABT9XXJ1_9BACI|nr:hypothetical protein [Neobacillus ginsengisoli]MDQ0200201.1 type IV secretory pathway VirB3-like protein [Neobacillus ginsengisoli]
MQKEFTNSTSSKTSVILGVIFGAIGIGLLFISVWVGLIFVVLAVVIFFLIRYFANDITVSCDENGFTVKVINKRKGTSVNEYTWKDVVETTYYEIESRGENSTKTRYFQAKTENGVVFNVYEMKNFDHLIQLFNQNTPQLSYFWESPKGLFSSSYLKQNRTSP